MGKSILCTYLILSFTKYLYHFLLLKLLIAHEYIFLVFTGFSTSLIIYNNLWRQLLFGNIVDKYNRRTLSYICVIIMFFKCYYR